MDLRAGCIGDRLETSRRFVGRKAELDLFRGCLAAATPPFLVLHVHGPGGIGKTALLREFERLARSGQRRVCRLDARTLEVSPPGFIKALRHSLGSEASGAFNVAREWPSRAVLLLDTYELIAALDPWLRDTFLPQLPADSLTVLAGRGSPSLEWTTDPAWRPLTHVLALKPLAPEEGREFLAAQGISGTQVAAVQSLAHGHPLALAMLAELARAGGLNDAPLQLEREPDAVHALLQRLLDHVPGAEHRRTLAVSAIARTTNEALLADVLGSEVGLGCFEWLRGLSFVECGAHGVFPHDSVRELLESDSRWRNPQGHAELQNRILEHLRRRFAAAERADHQRLREEHMFVRRNDPGMRPYFAWDQIGQAYAEPAPGSDHAAILQMISRHQGAEAAEIGRYWLLRQPGAFHVFRLMNGELCGFMANLELHELSAADVAADPAISAMRAFLATRAALQPGEAILYLRFWMDRDGHQIPSPAVNLTAAHSVACWLTQPRLAWNFIAMSDPEFWLPHFTSIRIDRCSTADFDVGGRRYGVFAHDWRAEKPAEWEQRRCHSVASGASRDRELSQEQFMTALRQALKDFKRPALLAANPLAAGNAAALQERLKRAVTALRDDPRDRKLYLALWHTYFEPEVKQEVVAEKLRMPFSTYRYHLAKGTERLAAALLAESC